MRSTVALAFAFAGLAFAAPAVAHPVPDTELVVTLAPSLAIPSSGTPDPGSPPQIIGAHPGPMRCVPKVGCN